MEATSTEWAGRVAQLHQQLVLRCTTHETVQPATTTPAKATTIVANTPAQAVH